MNPRRFWFIAFALFSISVKVVAQNVPICPAPVLLALSRAGSACFALERNQACYGNGSAGAMFQTSLDEPFAKAGDIVPLNAMRSIQTLPVDKGVSVVQLLVQASLSDTEAHSMALFMFGDVSITNLVDDLPEVSVTAKGTLNIRSLPEANSEIVTQLAVNRGLIANGRTSDQKWLRVHIPDSQALGWVAVESVSAKQSFDMLSVVDRTSPVKRPFQVMVLKTGNAALCDGTVVGGLLLQTPNVTQSVSLTFNGVDLHVSGTSYLETIDSGFLTINVVDGNVEIADRDQTVTFVPAGARLRVPIDSENVFSNGVVKVEPYVNSELVGLPLNNLPNRVKVIGALTGEQIASAQSDHQNQSEAASNAATPQPPPSCRYVTTGTVTLWAGPGEFYEAINEIRADARVYPVLQLADANGQVWWQLSNSNWIHANAVRKIGDCPEIPTTDVVPLQPYNTLSLETCKSLNGPLRVGQEVTIQFTPPAFENYYDASIALKVDPGRITIDERYQSVNASKPITIGTAGTEQERYVRMFATQWTATGGSHQIIGKRLSYILTCDITIPFG